MKVLIAGAGYVGMRLARRLLEQGHESVLCRRHPVRSEKFWNWLSMDLCAPATWPRLPDDVEAVCFSAAANRGDPQRYQQLFVQAQEALLEKLSRSGTLRRYLMISTTGIYGDRNGGWVDEETPANPATASLQAYHKGEKMILDQAPRGTVIRCSGIYGPGRNRLIRAVREGQTAVDRQRPQILNQIHVEDVAGVLAHCLSHPMGHGLILATDQRPASREEVLAWIAKRLNLPGPFHDPVHAPLPRHGCKRCRSLRLPQLDYGFEYPGYPEGYGALLDAETSCEKG